MHQFGYIYDGKARNGASRRTFQLHEVEGVVRCTIGSKKSKFANLINSVLKLKNGRPANVATRRAYRRAATWYQCRLRACYKHCGCPARTVAGAEIVYSGVYWGEKLNNLPAMYVWYCATERKVRNWTLTWHSEINWNSKRAILEYK